MVSVNSVNGWSHQLPIHGKTPKAGVSTFSVRHQFSLNTHQRSAYIVCRIFNNSLEIRAKIACKFLAPDALKQDHNIFRYPVRTKFDCMAPGQETRFKPIRGIASEDENGIGREVCRVQLTQERNLSCWRHAISFINKDQMKPFSGHRDILADPAHTFDILKIAVLAWDVMQFGWDRIGQRKAHCGFTRSGRPNKQPGRGKRVCSKFAHDVLRLIEAGKVINCAWTVLFSKGLRKTQALLIEKGLGAHLVSTLRGACKFTALVARRGNFKLMSGEKPLIYCHLFKGDYFGFVVAQGSEAKLSSARVTTRPLLRDDISQRATNNAVEWGNGNFSGTAGRGKILFHLNFSYPEISALRVNGPKKLTHKLSHVINYVSRINAN